MIGVDETKAGFVVASYVSLLVLLLVIYLLLHLQFKPSYDKKNIDNFLESLGKTRGELLKKDVKPDKLIESLKVPWDGTSSPDDNFMSEFSGKISYIKGFISSFKDEEKTLPQNDQRVVELKDKIEKMDKLASGLESNDRFFWISGPWYWLEIIFWGEFGVIIGILVWVCTQAENDKYPVKTYQSEKYWYAAEVFMGPVIVVAVFFLFRQFISTLIENVTFEEIRGSIYTTLGVAFTLGLFVRRSLGVFNFLKNKLPLPDDDKSKKIDEIEKRLYGLEHPNL